MIATNDAALVFSPGNWDITSVRAKTVYNGAYLRFACAEATSVVLNFDLTGASGTPQIKYRIDGNGWVRVNVAATVTIPLPSDNTWDRHVVEMVVVQIGELSPKWSTQSTHVTLTGINVDSIRTLPRRPRKVLFFGDSITAGHIVNQYPSSPTDDATVAWPYLAGQMVNAEVGMVGVGGGGWITTAPSGIPKLIDSYRYLWSGKDRDLAADMYVVNHGTNDTDFPASTVTAWLDDALPRFTPDAPVLIMRPFDGGHAADLSAAVSGYGDPRVQYVNTAGWWDPVDAEQSQHPNGYSSIVDLAPRLSTIMLASFGEVTIVEPAAGDVYLNIDGSPVAITGLTINT